MRLDRLTSRTMLALCELWLQEPVLRSGLRAHDVGVAVHLRLRAVYVELVELYAPHLVFGLRRLQLAVNPSAEDLVAIGHRLCADLTSRLSSESDAVRREALGNLLEVLFPGGPESLVHLVEEPLGRRRLAPPAGRGNDGWFTRIESIEIRERTLMEVYRTWAAVEDVLSRRARKMGVHDPSGRTVSAATKVRTAWLCTTRALVTAVSLLPSDSRAALMERIRHSLSEVINRGGAGALLPDLSHLLEETRPEFTVDPPDNEDTLEFDAEAFGEVEDLQVFAV